MSIIQDPIKMSRIFAVKNIYNSTLLYVLVPNGVILIKLLITIGNIKALPVLDSHISEPVHTALSHLFVLLVVKEST